MRDGAQGAGANLWLEVRLLGGVAVEVTDVGVVGQRDAGEVGEGAVEVHGLHKGVGPAAGGRRDPGRPEEEGVVLGEIVVIQLHQD